MDTKPPPPPKADLNDTAASKGNRQKKHTYVNTEQEGIFTIPRKTPEKTLSTKAKSATISLTHDEVAMNGGKVKTLPRGRPSISAKPAVPVKPSVRKLSLESAEHPADSADKKKESTRASLPSQVNSRPSSKQMSSPVSPFKTPTAATTPLPLGKVLKDSLDLKDVKRSNAAPSAEYNLAGEITNSKLAGEATRYDLAGEATRYDLAGEATKYDVAGEATKYDVAGEATKYDLAGEATRYDLAGEPTKYNLAGEATGYNLAENSNGISARSVHQGMSICSK